MLSLILILDKSVFGYTSTEELCDFVKNHFVVLSLVLHDECVTEEYPQALLNRFGEVLLADTYICPSARDIVEKESTMLELFGSFADGDLTQQYREELQTGKRFSKPNTVKYIHEGHVDATRTLLDSHRKAIVEIAGSEFEKAAEALKKSQAKKLERLRRWAEIVGLIDVHKPAVTEFAHFTDSPPGIEMGDDFLRQIFEEGKVLYEAEGGGHL